MVTRSFSITWQFGLAECSSPEFANACSRFKSKIKVSNASLGVDGKSLMGIMLLAAEQGSTIQVIAEGDDECEAMAAIEELFEKTFYREGWAC